MKTPSQRDDQYNILQAKQGDVLAFTRLVERYQTPVFNLCYWMLGNSYCAEAAAQESFLRAYNNIKRFDPGRSFVSWLLSIAVNYCIDHCAAASDRPMQLADARAVHPELILDQSEEHRALHRALGKLKALDRAVIVLRYWYNLSDAEIAEILRLSVPTVKNRLLRARRELATRPDRFEKHSILALSPPLEQFV